MGLQPTVKNTKEEYKISTTYEACAIQFPSSFVVIDSEEMEYLEGGGTHSYYYGRSDDRGIANCYATCAAMATYAGISALASKASAKILALHAPVAAIFSAVFKVFSLYTGYLAQQFFSAGEAARAIYKRQGYTITINTILDATSSVHCN